MLVITGTGRSGTTIIAKWLNELGLLPYKGEMQEQFNSGFHTKEVRRVNSAIWIGNDSPLQSIPAQKEAIRKINYPIITDSMFFYGNVLSRWLDVREDMNFLILLRRFPQVEKSRRSVGQMNRVRTAKELQSDLGRFISGLVFNDLPFEILPFPELADRYEEVREAIMSLEPNIDIPFEKGKKAWDKVIEKNLLEC